MTWRHLCILKLSSQLFQMLLRPTVHSGHLLPFVPGCDGRRICRMKDRRMKIKVGRPTQPTIVFWCWSKEVNFHTSPLCRPPDSLCAFTKEEFLWEGRLHVQESMFVFVSAFAQGSCVCVCVCFLLVLQLVNNVCLVTLLWIKGKPIWCRGGQFLHWWIFKGLHC